LCQRLGLFFLVAQGSIRLRQAIPRDSSSAFERDRTLQMRQRKLGLLLRHQCRRHAHMRFFKIWIVLQCGCKELLRLAKLVLLPMISASS